MFLNIQELVQEIESGKSTEEIVEERLAYLNSKEYQKNMQRSEQADFIQGFISDDEKIGFGLVDTTCYWMDEKQIFKDVIDSLIRKNISEVKKYNALNVKALMNGIQYYFLRAQPDKNGLEVYKQLSLEGKTRSDIREEFGERFKNYLLSRKGDIEKEELLVEINDRENVGNIIPIPISAIKGLGIGECTEMALMSQSLLSFLGYNTFMIEGKTINSLGNQESHHFNFIEKGGNYTVFDAATEFFAAATEIKTPEDLLIFDEMDLENKQQSRVYFSSRKAKIYSNPEAKIALLAKRGNNFRNSVMSDLHGIKLSKKITEKTDERD